MSTIINNLSGIRIKHTTENFLKFFVEHINIIECNKKLKIINEISTSRMEEVIPYLKTEMSMCSNFHSSVIEEVNLEFNLNTQIKKLQTEYNEESKNSTLSSEEKVKDLGIKVGEVVKYYRTLIKEKKEKNFDKLYQISLKFYDDVGGKTYHFDYTHNLNNFEKDIFNFFDNNKGMKKIIFADQYALYEDYGYSPSYGSASSKVKIENPEDEDEKHYVISRLHLIDNLENFDYTPLDRLVEDWSRRERISDTTRVNKITIHLG
jgi:hypothetical protein